MFCQKRKRKKEKKNKTLTISLGRRSVSPELGLNCLQSGFQQTTKDAASKERVQLELEVHP